jgi:hypothetical protein
MTRDDIIKMAREAGFNPVSYTGANLELFERFASLIAAAERETIQREWVELTSRDIDECYFAARTPDFDLWDFVDEIQECLKEKNCK